ncbi:MAG: hypothetical protein ACP5NV_02230 [Candidatus Woesearchaeota archaeon]
MTDNNLIKYDSGVIIDTDNKLVIASKSNLTLADAIQKTGTSIKKMVLENRLMVGDDLIIGSIYNLSFDFKYDTVSGNYFFGHYSLEKEENLTNKFMSKIFKNNNLINHDGKQFHPVLSFCGDSDQGSLYNFKYDTNYLLNEIKSKALKYDNSLLSNKLTEELYSPLIIPLKQSYQLMKQL